MRKIKWMAVLAGLMTAGGVMAQPQIEVQTVTNVVTVLVTNVVTITNVVPAPPADATAAPAAPAVVKYPWESSITAGLTLARGNSHTLMYSGDFRTTKKTPDNEFILGAGGAYGSQNSTPNVNTYYASGQWNHLFTDRFFGYLRADALRDLVADVDYRFNIGPGAGYYFIRQTNMLLSAEAGAGYQYQHLGNEFDSFATLRLAERFEYRFVNSRARFWQSAEILPQVDKMDNYILNIEVGIETVITKTFSLKTYVDNTYASRPASGRLKNDIKLISGIVYRF